MNKKDIWDINNGRCPDYALYWSNETNKLYWPKNHNFLKGYDTDKETDNEIVQEIFQEILNYEKNKKQNFTYYTFFRQILIKKYEKNIVNQEIILYCALDLLVCNIDDNIEELNLQKSGKQLWDVIKNLKTFIVIKDEYNTLKINYWCKSKLNTINIITYSTMKKENLKSYILIDNSENSNSEESNSEESENKIIIRHITTNETLNKLLLNLT
jgi:hypothetical protein